MHPAARLLQTSRCNWSIPRPTWSRTAQRANQPPETSPCFRPLSKRVRASLRRVDSLEWETPTYRANNQTGRPTIAVSNPPAAHRIVVGEAVARLTWHRWSIFSDQLTRVKSPPFYSAGRRNTIFVARLNAKDNPVKSRG